MLFHSNLLFIPDQTNVLEFKFGGEWLNIMKNYPELIVRAFPPFYNHKLIRLHHEESEHPVNLQNVRYLVFNYLKPWATCTSLLLRFRLSWNMILNYSYGNRSKFIHTSYVCWNKVWFFLLDNRYFTLQRFEIHLFLTLIPSTTNIFIYVQSPLHFFDGLTGIDSFNQTFVW